MRFFNRKGQSTLEYAVLIAGIVGAVLIFAPYLQRVVQGRFKESSDRIGYKFGGTEDGSFDQTYQTAWEESGTGQNISSEAYAESSGWNLESETTDSETVTRKEAESWGTAPASFETFAE